MAIDPTIALQTQVPQIQGPAQLLAQRTQIQGAQQEQALRGVQMAGLQRQMLTTAHLNQAYSGAMTTDANGVKTFDRGKLQSAILSDPLVASQWPEIQASLDKADQSALSVKQSKQALAVTQANALGWLAKGVAAAGNTPDAFTMAVHHAVANGTIDPATAQPYLDAVQQNPNAIAGLTAKLIEASPEASKAALGEKTETAREAEANTRNQIAQTEATNTEARLTEEARHNRVSEGIQAFNARANNPFGNIFAPGPGFGGSPAAPTATSPSAAAPPSAGGMPSAGMSPNNAPPAPGSLKAGDPLPGWTDASGPHGQAYLDSIGKQVPPSVLAQIPLYASGRIAFPNSYAMSKPYFQQLLGMVAKYDPSFDASDFSARSKARSDFTSPNGKAGQAITSLNRIAGHLQELDGAIDGLNNGDIQGVNWAGNYIKTHFTNWTGKTDFDTVAPRVADEIERLWRGSGGSAGEIQQTLGNLNTNMAPAQLHSAIAKTVKLVQSQFDALKAQKQSALGPYGANILLETPQTQQIFQRLGGGTAKQPGPQAIPEGTQKPIPGIAGAIAEFKGGKWIRVK